MRMLILSTTTLALGLLISMSASAAYLEDFDDGLSQGWIGYLNQPQPATAIVQPDGSPWVAGSDGEMILPWGFAVLDDGLGSNNYGDGTYAFDARFTGTVNPGGSRAEFIFLGSNPGPSSGETLYNNTNEYMQNSLFLRIGYPAGGGNHAALYYHSGGYPGSAILIASNADFLAGAPADWVYRVKIEVLNNLVSVLVSKGGEGSTNYQPLSGIQNIDISWTTVANSSGYIGLKRHDGVEKQWDNISFTPIPEPGSLFLVGMAALLLRKKIS